MQLAKLPSGYKQTEVGIIPADWELKPLGEFAQFRNGLNFIKSDRGDLVKVVGVADFQSHFSVTEDHLDSVQIAGSLGSDDLLKHNDLLFVRSNGNKALIGRCVLIQGFNQPVSFSGFTIRGRVSRAIASPEYIARYFHSNPARRQIKEAGEGSHISNLSQQVLASLKIPLPKLAEQEAIAAALSDADGLIESLEKLVAKKRQIKYGAMQELLTGQKRLPGFTGKWETKRLGEFVDTDPENLGSETRPDYTFNYISLEDVDSGTLRSYSEQVFQTAPSRARRRLRPDDVLVSTVRPNLLSHLLFTNEGGNWICSTGFCVVRCRQGVTHPYFVFSQVFSDGVKRQIEALLTGSNYPAINSGDVRALLIAVPNYDEQTAIAAILSDMDAEIAALEAKLAKARQVKQGMMQELLTGRIRFVDAAQGRES